MCCNTQYSEGSSEHIRRFAAKLQSGTSVKTTTMLLTLQQTKQTRTISAVSGGQVAVGVETTVLDSNC
jgi:hypothetical protein